MKRLLVLAVAKHFPGGAQWLAAQPLVATGDEEKDARLLWEAQQGLLGIDPDARSVPGVLPLIVEIPPAMIREVANAGS